MWKERRYPLKSNDNPKSENAKEKIYLMKFWGLKKICKNQQEVHLLDSELVELLKSLDPKEVLKTLL